ncbi:hypothetical protein T265_03254 [Opisthorchis viverrini]|uniref:Uncharacterized protein n=1 Tax=Opisthorchis viverrini TaxID=6198 RepID=A0A074ZSA6_OPIVI|nr:hypothetical protein T265_03254 [Opisthorchis viverrini]KER30308.1 hypothetical protein T265_03254 [Opisthorchis viverrini]
MNFTDFKAAGIKEENRQNRPATAGYTFIQFLDRICEVEALKEKLSPEKCGRGRTSRAHRALVVPSSECSWETSKCSE